MGDLAPPMEGQTLPMAMSTSSLHFFALLLQIKALSKGSPSLDSQREAWTTPRVSSGMQMAPLVSLGAPLYSRVTFGTSPPPLPSTEILSPAPWALLPAPWAPPIMLQGFLEASFLTHVTPKIPKDFLPSSLFIEVWSSPTVSPPAWVPPHYASTMGATYETK
ncbi:unnamed protein product, partial [Ilex paraguariensis]